MRILYVNDALAIWGGLERILIEKANYLADNYGYDICIVTSEQGNHKVPFKIMPRVKHIDLGINFYKQYRYKGLKRLEICYQLHRKYRSALKFVISDFCPDVIVAMRVDLVKDILKLKGHIPLIVESHACCKCSTFEGYGFWRRMLFSWHVYFATKADVVVSLTESDARDWGRIINNVCVIPNVVNLNPLDYYSSHEAKSVIFVGRLSKQKDVMILLKIWDVVSNRHPDWILNIYGEGDEEEHVKAIISQMDGRVLLHKPTIDIFEKYVNSSLLLLTSLYEPFGLVIPEAMSCGLPVVAFDCPYGPADIITDGIDGFVVKKRDVSFFSERVCMLLENKKMRIQMGQAAIASSQRYRPNIIMPKWKILFDTISKK